MEKPEQKSASGPNKVAATFLIVAGFFNFNDAMDLLKAKEGLEVPVSDKIIEICVLILAIISFVAGGFLLKRKKWAYILAIVTVALIIGLQALKIYLTVTAPIIYISIGIYFFVLLLLFFGRKDFNTKN